MICPRCNRTRSLTIDTRPTNGGQGRRRRKKCLNPACNHRWTTIEINVLQSRLSIQKELKLEYRRQIVASVKEDFHRAIDVVFQHINEA